MPVLSDVEAIKTYGLKHNLAESIAVLAFLNLSNIRQRKHIIKQFAKANFRSYLQSQYL